MLQIGAYLCLACLLLLKVNDVSSETVQGSILLNKGVFDKVISWSDHVHVHAQGWSTCEHLGVMYKVLSAYSLQM